MSGGNNFSSGLFDCCMDIPICCLVCNGNGPCVLGDNHSRVTGEGGCGPCCCYACLGMIMLCAIQGGKVRKTVRDKYGIAEDTGDCCLHCFCGPCAICQEAREIKMRQKQTQFASAPAQYPAVTQY
eukprot:TRINITY_DN7927_c0_g1_i1.p2 TRINITY_DN7927_c0_g1~~TRINITY_DN7927_c0_g1_i1.p2  ORF type:complete len:126 (-),score=4.54 TRINITY_DN7927_c0_g1_i1:232-609(-)